MNRRKSEIEVLPAGTDEGYFDISLLVFRWSPKGRRTWERRHYVEWPAPALEGGRRRSRECEDRRIFRMKSYEAPPLLAKGKPVADGRGWDGMPAAT